MSARCFLIRHAQAGTGEPRILGRTDLPLGQLGREQAEKLALSLAGVSLECIWSSDLLRARETAISIAHPHNTPLRIHTGLSEMGFGEWEGKPTMSILETREYRRWVQDPLRFPPPGGEPLVELKKRVVKTWEEITSINKGGDFAVVSHGGPIRVLLATFLDIPLEKAHHIGQEPSCVNIVGLYPEPSIHLINDTCHLA